jgi:glutaminase
MSSMPRSWTCRGWTTSTIPRELLASMSTALREAGKAGFLVDPDSAVIRTQHQFEAVAFTSVDDAVKAAEYWIRHNGSG